MTGTQIGANHNQGTLCNGEFGRCEANPWYEKHSQQFVKILTSKACEKSAQYVQHGKGQTCGHTLGQTLQT